MTRRISSGVPMPRMTCNSSSLPTRACASAPLMFFGAMSMPRVSGERFLASRSASIPLMPGRSWAETMTWMGVTPRVFSASVPLVARCTE